MQGLTIHEAAETTGWSARMLRYVERAGLVTPGRSSAGYRLYGPAQLQRLRTLKELLARFDIGLSDVAFSARMAAEPELRDAFAEGGRNVVEVKIVMDRDTGRPRGFAFVEMASGADEAIKALNLSQFQGRSITVNEARPREERPRGGGRGDRSRGCFARRSRRQHPDDGFPGFARYFATTKTGLRFAP